MVAAMTKPLRGVARRRAEALRLEEQPHKALLRPLAPSLIVTADEQDFVAAVLADLVAPDWSERLRARGAQRNKGVLALSQPVHRKFNLVLLEAVCDIAGGPRLDPRKIKGAGLVLRRVAKPRGLQGWMSAGPARRGWLTLGSEAADPDPAFREAPRSGHAEIDGLLAGMRTGEALTEQAFPLFVAPPDVCGALGKTVLYGVAPVTSGEYSETPSARPDYAAEAQGDGGVLDAHLSAYFRPPDGGLPLPMQGAPLKKEWVDDPAAQSFVTFLHQLATECGAFGSSPQAAAMMSILSGVSLQFQGGPTPTMPANQFLETAARIILEGEGNAAGLWMPSLWPAIDGRLKQAAYDAMSARFAEVASKAGKFDEQGRLYSLRAFIRVACKRDCPPKLVWSGASEAFSILPWWAGASPPVKVPLPDMTDRALLKSLKPGVAFELPISLTNFLDQDLSKFLGGAKLDDGSSGAAPGAGSSLGIAWVCSFSIPIITICAFIALNIVLKLLNIVFRWQPFFKICLPIPKRGG
jgi:hypothetical protein